MTLPGASVNELARLTERKETHAVTTIARTSNFLHMPRQSDGVEPEEGSTYEHGHQIPARGEMGYFRTYDQVKQAMYAMQAQYPGLVKVIDFGDSAEKLAGTADRDMLALEITNTGSGGSGDAATRPATLDFGGIHAREIANPELLMTYAKQLLDGYGKDADATMIVNTRRTVIAPIVNPDGHAVVERGLSGDRNGNSMNRKSTGNGVRGHQVDLNRNFNYHWGNGGSSSMPASDDYRGPAAESEPETKAMEAFMKTVHPTEFVDWHSYSRLNMFPWGDTHDHVKDYDGMNAIVHKFTTFNGYKPQQLIDIYPTSGTTTDYAYGAAGIPAAFGIETGDSFLQTDAEYQQTLKENLPVLAYHSKIADDPLHRVFGPDANSVQVDPTSHAVSAVLSETRSGSQPLVGAELVTDPLAAPGTGTPLKAADGAFNSPTETVTGAVSDALTGASSLIYVRGRDAVGNWGPLTAQWAAGHAPS